MSNFVDANLDSIDEFVSFLTRKREELSSISSKMKNTLSNLHDGWSGEDYDKFVSNVSDYLDEIKKAEVEIDVFLNIVNGNISKYNNKLDSFYEIVGRG